ncbi:MAG: type II toxin-antitoxin system Phd/YefM family antitoxin [Planctomyces sp.]
MSISITLDEAQEKLKEKYKQQEPGDEIIITENKHTVAKLTTEPAKPQHPRKAGNCIGMIEIISDDDEHLADFKEYM